MKPTDKYSGLTVERAREVLSYCPETGELTWRVSLSNSTLAGQGAGTQDSKGYLQTAVDRRKYRNHRLSWFIYYGVWPKDMLDHVDGDKTNNRMVNLREANNSHNKQNQRKARSDSGTGIQGVACVKGRYKAYIRSGRVRIVLGTYATPGEAYEAYIKAKRKLHPGNTL